MRRHPCPPRRDTNSNAAACIRYAPSPAAWSVWRTSRFTPADVGAVRPVARGGTTTVTIRPSLSAIIGAVGSRLPLPLPPNGCCCRRSRMSGTGRGATCSASISRLAQAGGQGNSRRNTVPNSSGWRRCAGRRRCWCLRMANARRRVSLTINGHTRPTHRKAIHNFELSPTLRKHFSDSITPNKKSRPNLFKVRPAFIVLKINDVCGLGCRLRRLMQRRPK